MLALAGRTPSSRFDVVYGYPGNVTDFLLRAPIHSC